MQARVSRMELQFPGLEKVTTPFLHDSIASLAFCNTVDNTVRSTPKDLLIEGWLRAKALSVPANFVLYLEGAQLGNNLCLSNHMRKLCSSGNTVCVCAHVSVLQFLGAGLLQL